ncbi:MAG: hypothetical protein GY841_22480 [FCB group bacterium]|nr:hypothetical protein [FCB group bacterium]
MKTCTKCGEEKPLGEFYKGENQCKVCKAEYNFKYYRANREKAAARKRECSEANAARVGPLRRGRNMMVKTCRKCGVEKWIDEFGEGTHRCKKCMNEYGRKNYRANRKKIQEYSLGYSEANSEKLSEYNNKYYKANKKKIAQKKRDWHNANREKVACHQVANGYNTLAVHKLDTCMVCGYKHGEIYRTGRPGVVIKHHWSYAIENANDVFPLCQMHHSRVHTAIREEPDLEENKMLQYGAIIKMKSDYKKINTNDCTGLKETT